MLCDHGQIFFFFVSDTDLAVSLCLIALAVLHAVPRSVPCPGCVTVPGCATLFYYAVLRVLCAVSVCSPRLLRGGNRW